MKEKISNWFGRRLLALMTATKRYKLFSIIAALGTTIVGFATFTESISKISDFIELVASWNKSSMTSIEYANLPEAEEKSIIENTKFGYKYSDDKIYSIGLRIRAKFSSEKFNIEPYLRSLSEIKFEDDVEAMRAGERFEDAMRARKLKSLDDIEAYFKSRDDLLLSHIEDQQIDHHELTTLLVLKTNKKPAHYQKVGIRMGAYKVTISLGAIDWKKFSYEKTQFSPEKTWWGAHGNISITIPDPTWLILREARILGGDPPVLEVTLDNRGDLAVPLKNVVLMTSHPIESHIACAQGDRPQQVALLWPSQGAQENTDGSWTVVSNHKLEVPMRYNFHGQCSHSYSMEAEIPVVDVVEPGKILRLSFSIERLPDNASASLHFRPGKPTVPRTLQEWKKIDVSVEPKDLIFPGTLGIDHDAKVDLGAAP